MVVFVPALPRADETGECHVVALGRRALDHETLCSAAMCKMTDEPVAGDAYANAHANPPDQPTHAANGEKEHSPRQLLQHPGSLHQCIELVVCKPGLKLEYRRPRQRKFAVKLPPGVSPKV